MAKFYWKGGPYAGSSGEYYSPTETYPSSYCWNYAPNWLVRVEGNTGDPGGSGDYSTGGYHFVQATTAPGGNDIVVFEKYTQSQALHHGWTYAFPLTPCLFGGYMHDTYNDIDLGWVNASNTGGYVSVVVNEDYGDITQKYPAGRIGAYFSESYNIANDYLDAGGASGGFNITFAGVVWPSGIEGFGGLKLKCSSFRDYHNDGSLWTLLYNTTAHSFVSQSYNSKYYFNGGNYTQMFFNKFEGEPADGTGVRGHSIRTDNSSYGYMDGSSAAFPTVNYLYVGDVFGEPHSIYTYFSSIRLSGTCDTIDWNAGRLSTYNEQDISFYYLDVPRINTINCYPQSLEVFDSTIPSNGYGWLSLNVLAGASGGTRPSVGTLNLLSRSEDYQIIDKTDYSYLIPYGGESGDSFAGANNLVRIGKDLTIETLNLDGGQLSMSPGTANETDSLVINGGRIGRNAILDLTPGPNGDPFFKNIKVGDGGVSCDTPSEGIGLRVSPEGGEIRLPLDMRFVAGYPDGKTGATFEVGSSSTPGIFIGSKSK